MSVVKVTRIWGAGYTRQLPWAVPLLLQGARRPDAEGAPGICGGGGALTSSGLGVLAGKLLSGGLSKGH